MDWPFGCLFFLHWLSKGYFKRMLLARSLEGACAPGVFCILATAITSQPHGVINETQFGGE